MKYICFISAVCLFLFSCEKEDDKFIIEYKFINKNDYRRMVIGINTNTYYPKEKLQIWKGEAFEINEPDTVALIVSTDASRMGYRGCSTNFSLAIEIYESVYGDSTYYNLLTYVRDTIEDNYWLTVHNETEGISTFIWPDDTVTWMKIQDYHDKWKNDN